MQIYGKRCYFFPFLEPSLLLLHGLNSLDLLNVHSHISDLTTSICHSVLTATVTEFLFKLMIASTFGTSLSFFINCCYAAHTFGIRSIAVVETYRAQLGNSYTQCLLCPLGPTPETPKALTCSLLFCHSLLTSPPLVLSMSFSKSPYFHHESSFNTQTFLHLLSTCTNLFLCFPYYQQAFIPHLCLFVFCLVTYKLAKGASLHNDINTYCKRNTVNQ